MVKQIIIVVVIFIVGFILTTSIEYVDRQRHDHKTLEWLEESLAEPAQTLEATLNEVVETAEFFARLLGDNPDIDDNLLKSFAEEWIDIHPSILSVESSEQYRVNFVYPIRGNERVINMNYGLRSEYLSAIQFALSSRMTVINAPVTLEQTGRKGVIVRSPYRVPSAAIHHGDTWGLASLSMDMNTLLIETGVVDPSLEFELAIVGRQNGVSVDVYGDAPSFDRVHARKQIVLPNGYWELIVSERVENTYAHSLRPSVIRGAGVILTLLVVFFWMRRQQFISNNSGDQKNHYSLSFKTSIRLLLIIPLTLTVLLIQFFAYQATIKTAEQYKNYQIDSVTNQLNARVHEFFSIPNRILVYNVEQFRIGVLNPSDSDRMVQNFYLQLKQNPFLTFLSVGTTDGEYFAASNPPHGDDLSVRLIESTIENDRIIRIYQADDQGYRNQLISEGNTHFDARTRPWFRDAVVSDTVQWYSTYRYLIQDSDGIYDTLGLGMSSVLHDVEGEILGVITADVALSQVDAFLREQVSALNGIAFLSEQPNGYLMATSTDEPTFFFSGEQTLRVNLNDSSNPVLRAMGRVLVTSGQVRGTDRLSMDDESYLIHWQTIQLPSGPTLILGIALPESDLFAPVRNSLLTNLVYTLFLWGIMILGILLLTRWFINPLVELKNWLKRLASGNINQDFPFSSQFQELQEIRNLSETIVQGTRSRLKQLGDELASKTKQVESAERSLEALNTIDHLTGIANRQYFEQVLDQELARANRGGQPMTLLLIELDQFTQYVDHFGEQDSEDVLVQVAKVCTDVGRRCIDLVARIDGPQFALIAPCTTDENGSHLAEVILRGLDYQGMLHPDSETGVFTGSIGLGVYHGDSEISSKEFFQNVEQALKTAQLEGGNRVTSVQ